MPLRTSDLKESGTTNWCLFFLDTWSLDTLYRMPLQVVNFSQCLRYLMTITGSLDFSLLDGRRPRSTKYNTLERMGSLNCPSRNSFSENTDKGLSSGGISCGRCWRAFTARILAPDSHRLCVSRMAETSSLEKDWVFTH